MIQGWYSKLNPFNILNPIPIPWLLLSQTEAVTSHGEHPKSNNSWTNPKNERRDTEKLLEHVIWDSRIPKPKVGFGIRESQLPNPEIGIWDSGIGIRESRIPRGAAIPGSPLKNDIQPRTPKVKKSYPLA